jgi:S1-C subfamily serine protease
MALAVCVDVCAQQSLETHYRITGPGITDLFEPQRQVIQNCSAVIYDGSKEISYGLVVSKNGHILTKASEIDGIEAVKLRVDKTSFDDVKVLAVDEKWDVALLKVEAYDLMPAPFADNSDLPQGSWVVVNGATSRTKRRVLAGIISASPREIPPAGGAALGIALADAKDKLEVKEDEILEMDGQRVRKLEDLAELMNGKKVGDELKVKVRRKGKEVELVVKLTAKAELFLQPDRNDQMSGVFSIRRSGFPRVIQHDVIANRYTMGGPVLDIRGQVIGMNIARANRCETFAVPVEELRELVKGMMEKASN